MLAILVVLLAMGGRDPQPDGGAIAAAIAPGIAGGGADWEHYGGDAGGSRFSPLDQINSTNVKDLAVAWIYRTGHRFAKPVSFEATPLKIADTLYLCTPDNEIVALDAETGKERWRFNPRVDRDGVFHIVCRGVAYYRNPAAAVGKICAERIFTASIDDRLFAVDAGSGAPCPDFGENGAVNLLTGFGDIGKGFYYVTSAPQVIRGKVVLGGWVTDNLSTNGPSGVVRAFDAVTGAMAWAFDMGRPDLRGLPPAGQTFTPGTPNSWAPISADEQLGLVYLPTGNAGPDWFGGNRRSFDDKYASSVVAVDAETGAVRWSFQTTHHDLWDYDVASQPTLYDMPLGGQRVPALIQPTKRGEIFVLDRRTGAPLTEVIEREVPVSHVPEERASATQPFSVGMPSFAGPPLTEAMMWGLSPIDQAWCRLQFKRARYDGPLTPADIDRPSIAYPGFMGGIDWGGVAVDKSRDILIVNAMRMALTARLVPRAEADRLDSKPDMSGHPGDVRLYPMSGTPYALLMGPFLSPLRVPCQQPPYGTIGAVDMKTRQLIWSHGFGTARENGPFSIRSKLPFAMGAPNTGGAIATRGGLTFIGAAADGYLRAYDTATGEELWKAALPAGGQATPLTYLSKRSGRQFVVIAAGGSSGLATPIGDYVVAFALPPAQERAGP